MSRNYFDYRLCARYEHINFNMLTKMMFYRYEGVDVSVAVDTGNGLITPIVFGAHTKVCNFGNIWSF